MQMPPQDSTRRILRPTQTISPYEIELEEKHVIARMWRGVVPIDKTEGYLSYLAGFGFRDYKKYRGYLGAHLFHRQQENQVQILFLSFWESRQAIAAYAGNNIERAQYYAYDFDCLGDPSPNVEHYEVIASAKGFTLP